jgi:hypothetical protein
VAVGDGAELLKLIQRLGAEVAVAQQLGDPLQCGGPCGGRCAPLGVTCAALLKDGVHEGGGQLLAGDVVDQLGDLVGPRQRRLHRGGVKRAVGVGDAFSSA